MKSTINYRLVNVIQNDKSQYGVTDNDGKVIVPFVKYGWISGFDHGLARMKSISGLIRVDRGTGVFKNPKWGIIDMKGNEVLPVEYDEVWNFLGKGWNSTRVIKSGQSYDFGLNSFVSRSIVPRSHHRYVDRDEYNNEEYGSHYGEYAGSYAQDIMGYSGDVIDDAFDGDPDAYWNIDKNKDCPAKSGFKLEFYLCIRKES